MQLHKCQFCYREMQKLWQVNCHDIERQSNGQIITTVKFEQWCTQCVQEEAFWCCKIKEYYSRHDFTQILVGYKDIARMSMCKENGEYYWWQEAKEWHQWPMSDVDRKLIKHEPLQPTAKEKLQLILAE